nr:PREDICTED: tRNA pseudouridine synthase-like 1 isoform X4 [Struthio camelus australis]
MASPKTRYLVFFQYFGSKYSGVMETSTDQSVIGVQNYMEKAAQNLKPVVPIKFHISSRTDTGVHALCNSAHLDIQRATGKPPFHERELVCSLNYHLKSEPIRVLSAYRVANSFHARFSALSRTYVYRLLMGCTHHSEIPVFERDLCWAPGGGYLNVPAMQDAAWFLLGTHDFSTFRSLNSETPFRSPVRTILQVDIRPSSGFLSHHYEYSLACLLVCHCLCSDAAAGFSPAGDWSFGSWSSRADHFCTDRSEEWLGLWLQLARGS